MTDQPLSSAAQAVLDAAADVYWDWSDMSPASSSIIAATALKVAANDWRIDTEFIGGVEYIRTSTLDAIANELEGK
jgi:hypothetical protein